MSKIRFGIIGYGNIGKRHARHILEHSNATLCAVCDLLGFPIPTDLPSGTNFYDNIHSMLELEALDVVNVCTPNYLHHPHTLLALKNKYHVVCEKPMALSSVECIEMMDCANEHQRNVFVVMQNRFNEPVQQVKQLLEQNVLGKIFLVNINCFWNRNEHYYFENDWRGKLARDGGCLFTQFSHFVDILFYLFGDFTTCMGFNRNFAHPYIEIEDNGSFIMESSNGAIINFNYSTCSYEKNMEGAITIIGEHGTVKIGGEYLNTIEYQQIRHIKLPQSTQLMQPNDYGHYQGSMSNHDKMIDNVINTLQGKDSIMTSAMEGMLVVGMIEKMYAAHHSFQRNEKKA